MHFITPISTDNLCTTLESTSKRDEDEHSRMEEKANFIDKDNAKSKEIVCFCFEKNN